MEPTYLQRHPGFKDAIGIIVFVLSVLIGTLVINTFIFRSFNVLGPSMESTFFTGDRLIVNRLPVTWAQLQNKDYVPERGEIIVFKNPQYTPGTPDEYIVKRVIAFPGERVTVTQGILTVFNKANPNGFHPDENYPTKGKNTSGTVNTTVPDGTLFVAGDHREGSYSFDSRSGLGTIPYYDVVGPVGMRIYPLNKIGTY